MFMPCLLFWNMDVQEEGDLGSYVTQEKCHLKAIRN